MGASMRRLLIVAALTLPPLLSAGCVPAGVWLPDSSGYVYTAGENGEQLLLYDVEKRESRVLVKDTKAPTHVPAVSPDGKRVAVARISKSEDDFWVQVIVYDLAGKEQHRSAEHAWKPRKGHDDKWEYRTELYWARQGDRLLVHAKGIDDIDHPVIYDLTTKTMTDLPAGSPVVVGNALARPDGAGFLFLTLRSKGDLIYTDWTGKQTPIKLKQFKLDQEDGELYHSLFYPHLHTDSRWDGDVAVVRSAKRQMRIDTRKLVATLEEGKEERTEDKKPIRTAFPFGKDGPAVRVVELKASDVGFKADRPEEDIDVLRVELRKPGDAKPKVLVDWVYGWVQLVPSPDKKWLAVESYDMVGHNEKPMPVEIGAIGTRRIILVNERGEVVADIGGRKTK
jgi:dipeptidyl aminopeptidase/acylaminoacyl peptidase